jgi:hypothetical protein
MLFARSAPYRLVLIAIVSLLVGTGCVSHAPMSETLMFREPGTSPRHTARVGAGGTVTVPMSDRQRLLSSQLRNRPSAEVYTQAPNGGAYLAFYEEDGGLAFSATAGYFLGGFDATIRLLPATYLTGAISIKTGQIYVQRRIYNEDAVGAAVGAGYRRIRLITDDYDSDVMFDFEAVTADIIGLRPHALFRMTDKNNIGMRVALFGGMTMQTREPYVSLSLTVGGF